MNTNHRTRVAIPSVSPGGLEATRSGHFGRCDCFTLIDIEGKKIAAVEVIENPPHTEGGCLGPVTLLASQGVNSIVVQGIGLRPLMGFRKAGIEVYVGFGETVGSVAESFIEGRLEPISEESACGGH